MLDTKNKTNKTNSELVCRLRAQMLRKGLNPKTLAERANVGRSFVYDILSGRSCNPTSAKIAAIADKLDISMQYLLSGTHPNPSATQQHWAGLAEVATLDVEPSASGSLVVSKTTQNSAMCFSEKFILETLSTNPTKIRQFCITCDSMQPTLQISDTLLIDTGTQTITGAGLYLIFDGNNLKPRRLELLGQNRAFIGADNPRYVNFETSPNEIVIVGKVVWLGRTV